MVSAAFRALGVDATYEAVSVPLDSLAQEVAAMRLDGVKGFNVTIPFKCAIAPLLGRLSAIPWRIQAVNTAKLGPEGFEGFNTDVEGITTSLQAHGVRSFDSSLLVGAGGTARAFFEAASTMGCSKVVVAVRDPLRASEFVQTMRQIYSKIDVRAVGISDISEGAVDLIFNASPIGSPGIPTPQGLRAPMKGSPVVFDAVYRPRQTELLRWAEEERCMTVPGHEMLLNQAIASVRIWTGLEPPSSLMNKALQVGEEA